MWTLFAAAALAAIPDLDGAPSTARVGAEGHALSIAGEITALSALPFLAAGATGMTLAAVRDPSEYARSPYVEVGYLGVGLAGVGVPLTLIGAELEAKARRNAGETVTARGDIAGWATYGVAFATMAVGLPVATAVGNDNAIAGPIVVGSAGLVSTTLWLCSVGLGAGYRGQLQRPRLTTQLVPTGDGVAVVGRF